MYYTMDGQVRYSEVDLNGNLTIDGIVNYMQDTCMLQSESLGVGWDSLHERGVAWILSSWQIQILKCPKIYDRIKVTTSPYDFNGFFGYRNFWIQDDRDEMLIRANSIWVYLDMNKMKPARVPQEELDAYAPYMPRLDMEYAPRKMHLPEQFEACEPIPVHPDMIDLNLHVNNCQYIKMALKVAKLTALPKEIRVEYRKQACLGDTLYPFLHKDEEQIVVDLRDEKGVSYAPVQFLL